VPCALTRLDRLKYFGCFTSDEMRLLAVQHGQASSRRQFAVSSRNASIKSLML